MFARSVPAALGLALLLTACLQPVQLALPQVDDSPALIFVHGLDSESPAALLFNPNEPLPQLGWPNTGEVLLLTLPVSAAELQLSPGPLRLVELDAPGRGLPNAGAVWRGQVDQGRVRWNEGPALAEAELQRLRIPAFDANACAEAGGCPVKDRPLACTIPCPSPDRAQLPATPRLTQRPDWQPVMIDGEPWMAPDDRPVLAPIEPERLECAQGQMRRPDEPACRAISPCPAPGTWPSGPPDAVYVRLGAASGDGSAARPYGSLRTALQQAPAERSIIFEGRFDLEALVSEQADRFSQITLQGTCTERATLFTTLGPLIIPTQALDWSDLSLDLVDALDLRGNEDSQVSLRRLEVREGTIGLIRGQAEISDSSFTSVTGVGVVGSYGAQVTLTGVYMLTNYALHFYNRAGLRVRDSLFEGRRTNNEVGHGLSCATCSHVDFERSVLRGFNGAAIGTSNTPSVRFIDGQILGVSRRGVATALCHNNSCLEPGQDGFTISTTVSGSLIRSEGAALVLEAGRLHVQDSVVRTVSNAVELRMGSTDATEIQVHRVAIRDVEQQGFRLLGTWGEHRVLHVTDTLMKRGEGVMHDILRSMMRAQFFHSTLERVHIDGSFGDGIVMRCGGGTIEDVVVDDIRDIGFRMFPSQPLNLARIHARGAQQTAMLLYADEPGAANELEPCGTLDPEWGPEITISDLTLDSALAAPRGLSVCSGAPANLTRAEIRGFREAIHLQEGLLDGQSISLQDNDVGVSSPADVDISNRLFEITYQGTSRPVQVRLPGESPCPY